MIPKMSAIDWLAIDVAKALKIRILFDHVGGDFVLITQMVRKT